MDLPSIDGRNVVKTKATRKIGEEWVATLILGIEVMPNQFCWHRQTKNKQSSKMIIPLPAPIPQVVDEEAEAVCDYVPSESYSASEALDEQATKLISRKVREAHEHGRTEAMPSSPTRHVVWPKLGLAHVMKLRAQRCGEHSKGNLTKVGCHILVVPPKRMIQVPKWQLEHTEKIGMDSCIHDRVTRTNQKFL